MACWPAFWLRMVATFLCVQRLHSMDASMQALVRSSMDSSSREGGPGGRALPLVAPTEDHQQLEVVEEGLAALEAMEGDVAPVVVIGPYRSGKSFLLNQLMGVGCDSGFGVGHTRDTQTKGVWVWSEGVARRGGEGPPVTLVFMDTEGLESARRIDTYDDRIFAFSAVVSSLLVYNLAEAVRESDVAKLSFATQLGKEFMADAHAGGGSPLQPNAMLWLIQRDFLGGKSVEAMLAEALEPVPNPAGDPALAAVNDVRVSLGSLARNSTAFGLPQPHLDRTKLCELSDKALAPDYLAARKRLRALVHRLAAPKELHGSRMSGPELSALVRQVVKILNTHKIPTVHNVIDSFNTEVVARCQQEYAAELDSLAIPVSEEVLQALHEQVAKRARQRLAEERFGKRVATAEGSQPLDDLAQKLNDAIDREYKAHEVANRYESSQVCERAEGGVEESLEAAQGMRLPSARKFEAVAVQGEASFRTHCVGPAVPQYEARLQKAVAHARQRFTLDYNSRLFMGMVVVSLAMVAVFRFALRVPLLELLGWLLFLGLEGSGQLGLGGGQLYETRVWRALLAVWEAVVYNPLLDLERHWPLLLAAAALGVMAHKALQIHLQRHRRSNKRAQTHSGERDLDV